MLLRSLLDKSSCCKHALMVTGLVMVFAIIQPCAGDFKGIGSTVFSLDVKNEALGEVMQKVSAITGFQIMISPEWSGWTISARLENVSINYGLRQLLSELNHFIVFNEAERRISIIIDSSVSGEGLGKGSLAKVVDQGPPSVRPLSAVILNEYINPADIQVIPPENSGGPGFTQKDLDEIEFRRSKIDPANIEVIPPTEAGEKGVTVKEAKTHQTDQFSEALKYKNLVPPDGFVPK